jgi:hypothetical protein
VDCIHLAQGMGGGVLLQNGNENKGSSKVEESLD